MLKILWQNKLFLKPKKCSFEVDQVDYLGVVISSDGVAVDPKKVEAIVNWPQPRKLVEVQEFVGFLNFYWRFIEGFSQIARLLHNLTKKEAELIWTPKCEKAFAELKSQITTTSVLATTREEGLRIEADACQYTIRGVLLQEQEGVFRPIAYYSKSLNDTERNYDIHDRELLAIMKTLKEWRYHLIGRKNSRYGPTTKTLNTSWLKGT